MPKVVRMKKKEATWRREHAIEHTFALGTRVIVIFRHPGESELDVQEKLDLFRAGEDVKDVHSAGPKGGEEKIWVISFVDPKGQWWEGLEPLA